MFTGFIGEEGSEFSGIEVVVFGTFISESLSINWVHSISFTNEVISVLFTGFEVLFNSLIDFFNVIEPRIEHFFGGGSKFLGFSIVISWFVVSSEGLFDDSFFRFNWFTVEIWVGFLEISDHGF